MIQVHVDTRGATAQLTAAEERQVPFAMKQALNTLANEAQRTVREGLQERFKLRRSEWNLRGIYIAKNDRASKTTWRVVIQVSEKTNYLDKFEKGGDKLPVGGHAYLWEPNDKVFKNRILPQGDPLRPKNLNLHRDPHGRVIGDNRTFLAKTGNSEMPFVVVQRREAPHKGFTKGSMKSLNLNSFGRKQLQAKKRGEATVTLYKLRKRIPVKAQLQFVPTITKVVQSRFRQVFATELASAMRTAR